MIYKLILQKVQTTAAKHSLCALLLFIVLFAAPVSSYCDDEAFTVFKVKESIHVTGDASAAAKDFYINGGTDNGISKSMMLDVYREKVVRDPYKGQDLKINILVGKLKVFEVYKNVSVTRIASLTSSDESPVLKYRTVMIGDYAVLKEKKVAEKQDKESDVKKAGVILPGNVLFKLNDWKLRPDASGVLSEVYDMFHESGSKNILIEGHTCSLGPEKHNLELSRKRAQSVADYLVNTRGIPLNNIQVKYYGEQKPAASNNDKEGRIKNRRVEIHFLSNEKTASLEK